jgi:hypothetical protein
MHVPLRYRPVGFLFGQECGKWCCSNWPLRPVGELKRPSSETQKRTRPWYSLDPGRLYTCSHSQGCETASQLGLPTRARALPSGRAFRFPAPKMYFVAGRREGSQQIAAAAPNASHDWGRPPSPVQCSSSPFRSGTGISFASSQSVARLCANESRAPAYPAWKLSRPCERRHDRVRRDAGFTPRDALST